MKAVTGSEGISYRAAIGRLRRMIVVAGLFSAAVNILMLTGPVYMLQIYDRVLSSASVPTLLGLMVAVVVLYAFLGVYDFLRKRLLSRASYRLDALIGDRAFADRIGGATGNTLRNLEAIRTFMSSPAILGIFDLPWIPIFLFVVFLIHPFLGWLTLGGSLVAIAIAFVNERATQRYAPDIQSRDARERIFAEAGRRNAEMVQALGMQGNVSARWRFLHNASLAAVQRSGDLSEGFSSGSRAFRMLLQSLLLSAGAYLAIKGEISSGMIVATSILSGRALSPVDQVIGSWRSIARAHEAHRSLSKNLGEPSKPASVSLPDPKGNLSLDAVIKFSPGTEGMAERPRILNLVSFALRSGDGLAVMGNSAAGKSSLARLLVGACKPDLGEYRLDGATPEQWPADVFGRQVGYLPQSVELLPGTIADNIARFDKEIDKESLFTAARIAGVHDMILSMPKGYSTLVGDVDHALSGGQVQRLGLARALYGDPKLLVLDEPNAHLDSAGDEALKNLIDIMRSRGSTVIVMTHRPSVLSSVNKVLVLHKGHVVHFGDKEAFLKNNVRPVETPKRQVG
jgi:ATP-binding cassette subfamily C exporter for protease/lipase